jgi:eukaryotic-like serine/threonine-protein kinase
MAIDVNGIQVGDVLAGKYRIERILGAGGMGVVVAVHHLHLDQRFALKLMLPELLASEEAVTRFMREARLAAKIKSDHVVRVSDVDSLESGAPYIVMELLEGRDLAALLRDKRVLPIEDAVDLVLQVCEVAAEAHGLGIVHRDLKPSNLFVTQAAEGRLFVKVLDFGISKVTRPGAPASAMDMTKSATSMGSPFYMSPEQMQSARDVDGRTDIWALGTILYELVTGRVPFGGATPIEVALKIAAQQPPPLRTLRPDAPPGIEVIVLKCLEKDASRRFGNIAELASALAEFAPARSRVSLGRIAWTQPTTAALRTPVAPPNRSALKGSLAAHPSTEPATIAVVPDAAKHESAGVTAPRAWGTTMPPKRGGRTAAMVAVAGVVAVAAGLAAFAAKRRASQDTPPEASTDVAVLVSTATANATATGTTTPTAPANTTPTASSTPPPEQPVLTHVDAHEPAAQEPRPSPSPRSENASAPKREIPRSSRSIAPVSPMPSAAPPAPSASARSGAAAASSLPRGVWQDRK